MNQYIDMNYNGGIPFTDTIRNSLASSVGDPSKQLVPQGERRQISGIANLRLDVSPSPYIGFKTKNGKPAVKVEEIDFDAFEVMILCLNPGFGKNNENEINFKKLSPQQQEDYAKLEAKEMECNSRGFGSIVFDQLFQAVNGSYWIEKLRRNKKSQVMRIIDQLYLNRIRTILQFPVPDSFMIEILNKMVLVDLFPYHSVKAPYIPSVNASLPTQKWAFDIVNEAVNRGKPIIITRSEREWENRVPKLEKYQYCFTLKNPRNIVFSQKNLSIQNAKGLTGWNHLLQGL